MCDCNKRIEKLKEVLNFGLNIIHDTIAETTDESPEWYEAISEELDQIKNKIREVWKWRLKWKMI